MQVTQKMRQRSEDERTDFGLEVRWSVLSGDGAETLSSDRVKQSQNFGGQIGFQKTSSAARASIFQNDFQNLEEVAGDEPAEGVERWAVAVVPAEFVHIFEELAQFEDDQSGSFWRRFWVWGGGHFRQEAQAVLDEAVRGLDLVVLRAAVGKTVLLFWRIPAIC